MSEPMNYQCEYSSSVLREWKNTRELAEKAILAYRESCQSVAALASSNADEAQMLTMQLDHTLINFYPQTANELVHSRANLARARNCTKSRFQSLPNEIIRMIFMDLVYAPAPGDPRSPAMNKALETMCSRLIGLISVCSSWRNIGLNSSELWSFIPLSTDHPNHPSPLTSLFLERALASAYNNRPLYLVTSPSLKQVPHLPLVTGNVPPRFTSINIEGCERQICDLIGSLLQYASHEALSELSIHQVSNARNRRGPYQALLPSGRLTFGPKDDVFRSLIGSLSTLRVSGANLMWDQIAFSQKLVELRVQSVVLGHSHSALPNFARALQSAPELQDLKIIGLVTFPDTHQDFHLETPAEIVSLPKLKSLLLEDLHFNVLSFLLRSIAPGSHHVKLFLTLKALQLLLVYGRPVEITSDRLIDLLKGFKIDTLLLRGDIYEDSMWLEDLDLRDIIGSLPTLSVLKMANWKFNEGGLLALAPVPPKHQNPQDVRGLFPSLSHLTLSDCAVKNSDASTLLHVVASHPLQSLEIGPFGAVVDTASLASKSIARLKTMVPNFREARAALDMEDFAQHVWQLW
ncbi:hypothetical protein RSOLAG22IIIB_06287 [Rhizoctonia solani]|uniref:F-box domain-containing protein n=1 Tax=Rhizoctonia solani TaxID=456999 RepID=A0A0K6GDB7_9AGAM|nr:hypothetical protein RSOLAG22IIIB_06287 [Rhizoctonia solani]